MARPKKETHLFFEQGADEIQIRSWDKDLNAAVMRLKAKHPGAGWIRENADDEPGFLWGAVKRENFSFHTVLPRSERTRTIRNIKNEAGSKITKRFSFRIKWDSAIRKIPYYGRSSGI